MVVVVVVGLVLLVVVGRVVVVVMVVVVVVVVAIVVVGTNAWGGGMNSAMVLTLVWSDASVAAMTVMKWAGVGRVLSAGSVAFVGARVVSLACSTAFFMWKFFWDSTEEKRNRIKAGEFGKLETKLEGTKNVLKLLHKKEEWERN